MMEVFEDEGVNGAESLKVRVKGKKWKEGDVSKDGEKKKGKWFPEKKGCAEELICS